MTDLNAAPTVVQKWMVMGMVESLLAWVILLSAVIHDEPLYYVSAAGFAIAGQISRVVDRMDGDFVAY